MSAGSWPYRGRTAVITGAGSGIGLALAQALAARGCHLALCDVRQDRLDAAVAALEGGGVSVTGHALDVADKAAVAALPEAVLAAHEGAALLINNAGVALGGRFDEIAEADFDWLFEINFHGPVRMTRAFLPLLRQERQARIVNVSSLFGLVAPAGQTAYAASKFALRGFSEALRHEFEGTPLGVTVVHPGGVATAIAKDARVAEGTRPEMIEAARRRAEKGLRMPPAEAAAIILAAIEREAPRVLVGSDAKVLEAVQRLLPGRYWSLLGRIDALR